MPTLTCHQPNYLPYPGFFSKVLKSDGLVIVDHVQFSIEQKRNLIQSDSGTTRLSLSIKGSRRQRICDAYLANPRETEKHWGLIQNSYRNYPYFDEFGHRLKSIFIRRHEKFGEFTAEIIKELLSILGFRGEIWTSSKILDGNFCLRKSEMIIHICKMLNFDSYLSGLGAKDYIEESLFLLSEIKHSFNEYEPIRYDTPRGASVENMCVLDAIFSIGPIETARLLV